MPNHNGTSVERMRHALEALAEGLSCSEAEKRYGYDRTRFREMYDIIARGPDLIDSILAGDLTTYKAYQIVSKGERVHCPVCDGRGYVFRKRKKP